MNTEQFEALLDLIKARAEYEAQRFVVGSASIHWVEEKEESLRALLVIPEEPKQEFTGADWTALNWAVRRADEWYGNVTGDRQAEQDHKAKIAAARAALRKLK